MAIGQITVPYRPGYDFGVGAVLATGSPMGKVVTGDATPVENAAGATVNFEVQRIQSTEELEEALGIDAEASYGSGSFGASVSARFSFAEKAKIHNESLFMLIKTEVKLEEMSIDDPKLTDSAKALVESPGPFSDRYGNMFVRGIGRGGLFVGTIRIETESSEQSQEIAAELKGSYGLFSAEVKANYEKLQTNRKISTYINMYHEGGPPDLKITDLTNPLQLLDNANAFIDSFKDRESAKNVAVPYAAYLAPIAIAEGPVPLDAAVLQFAQDVLVECAKARSRVLDKVNLLEYILDNETRFEFTDRVKPTALSEALANFQGELRLIAQCASTAIRSPEKAQMPAEYAKTIDADYQPPKLPDLPSHKAGKEVAVPDFAACRSESECHKAATDVGLVAEIGVANVPAEAGFRVVSQYPQAGHPAQQGWKVSVTIVPVQATVGPKVFDASILATNIVEGVVFEPMH